MMEPMFLTEIQSTADCSDAIHLVIIKIYDIIIIIYFKKKVLSRRRGHVISELAKPG